jgi:hypothetical protein
MALAEELNADWIILDDRAARRCAERRKLPVTGTLGVLLAAKAQQLTPSVQERMDALIAAGLYVSPATYQEVLRRAGEP